MGQSLPLLVAIVLLSLFGHSQAACSPCPFFWSEHQHHCYLYFSSPLPYGQAEEYCRRQHARRYAGGLAALDSMDEIVFLMNYVGRVLTDSMYANTPKYVWLEPLKVNKTPENYSVIYFNALNAANESDHYFRSCDALSPATAVSLSEIGTGNYGMVPAPELVEQRCAVYAGEGAYLDLGDYAGTCVSDPDLCTSQAVTWSVWIKMNSSVVFNAINNYYLCSGGYTRRARGIAFVYKTQDEKFQLAARSILKTRVLTFSKSRIPMDSWVHLAFTLDLKQTIPELQVYLNGAMLTEDSSSSSNPSTNDLCTDLVLGSLSPCPDIPQTSSTKGASAAYSNLEAFDQLLTAEQIYNLHACGSLDWDLKVRSLHLDANSSFSGNLRYVCKASASTGPTIYWKVYHADQAQWEDLGPSSGPGVDITPTSHSTCVVQSVLVIDRSRGPSSEGDIISCTASSNSLNASVYFKGKTSSFGYSDHNKAGYLFNLDSGQYYQSDVSMDTEDTLGDHPFICEKESLG